MTPGDIQALRKTLKLTQGELAARCGVSLRAVQYWLAGTSPPSGPALRLLAGLQAEAKRIQARQKLSGKTA